MHIVVRILVCPIICRLHIRIRIRKSYDNLEILLIQHFLLTTQTPPLARGKGSGEFGQNPWASVKEFPCTNQIAALCQSYD